MGANSGADSYCGALAMSGVRGRVLGAGVGGRGQSG